MKIRVCIILVLTSLAFNSCLKSDLEDLPAYEGMAITGVNKVVHRFYDESVDWVDGKPVVAEASLSKTEVIDAVAATVNVDLTIPATFPESQKPILNLNNLVVIFNISTAAVMTPLDGAPKPGVPGDWSAPRRYNITAGNGNSTVWTVTLTLTP